MVESAALLVDEVLPCLPMRQWLLSFPFQLRFLLASRPEIMSRVSGIVYRAIETHLIQQAGCTRATARTGAVTLIQRFGSALTKSPGAILNSRRLFSTSCVALEGTDGCLSPAFDNIGAGSGFMACLLRHCNGRRSGY